MRYRFPSLTILLSTGLVTVGCASTPNTHRSAVPHTAVPATAAVDCRQLDVDLARLEKTKQEALEKERTAWKAVVPFAVAGRFASGKAEARKADEQLTQLRAEQSRRGCERQGA